MPNFWVTDVKTARLTLRNPTPMPIECIPYLLIKDYWGGVPITIPGNGQVTVDIGVSMSLIGVGSHTVQVAVYAMDDITPLLVAPAENVNIYAVGVELVGIVWV